MTWFVAPKPHCTSTKLTGFESSAASCRLVVVLRTCVVHEPASPELVDRKTASRPVLNVPDSLEEKFWDEWPGALRKAVDRCEKDQTRLFFSEVLVPTLDGVMPAETATASAR